MGFRRRNEPTRGPSRIIRPDLVSRLPDIGVAVFRGDPPYPDVSDFYLPGFLAAGAPTGPVPMHAFSVQLVTELRDGALPLGGWATAGAFYVAKDFVSSDFHAEAIFVEVMDGALRFLVAQGVGGDAIPNFALMRFIEVRDGRL